MRVVCFSLGALALCAVASAQRTSINLTSGKLGLGNVDLNSGSTVSGDVAGKFFTSVITGQGSILRIQRSGLAGSGSLTDPLIATVTSKTHLDTLGLAANSDYYAGAIYMTKDGGGGLGVRAFTTDSSGNRKLSGGKALIEGSKGVSGGNGPATFDPNRPNGAPHVDESVLFSYERMANVGAKSIEVTINELKQGNVVYYMLETAGGQSYSGSVSTSDLAFLEKIGGDKKGGSYKLKMSGIAALSGGDVASRLTIRAVNPNPADTSLGTKEHFLIDGFSYAAVPEPGTMAAIGLGLVALARKRRSRKS